MTRLFSIAAAAVMLQACATAPVDVADLDGRVVCDRARMDEVDRAARKTFSEVHWIQCPQATVRVVRQ